MTKAEEMLDLADAIDRCELVWCHPEGLGAVNANEHQAGLIKSALRLAAEEMTKAQEMLVLADRLEKFGPEALITRAEFKIIVANLRLAAQDRMPARAKLRLSMP
jgi:hypothetical protein